MSRGFISQLVNSDASQLYGDSLTAKRSIKAKNRSQLPAMLPHRLRVADRSAGVVFSPLRAVGRDTLPTGVVR